MCSEGKDNQGDQQNTLCLLSKLCSTGLEQTLLGHKTLVSHQMFIASDSDCMDIASRGKHMLTQIMHQRLVLGQSFPAGRIVWT